MLKCPILCSAALKFKKMYFITILNLRVERLWRLVKSMLIYTYALLIVLLLPMIFQLIWPIKHLTPASGSRLLVPVDQTREQGVECWSYLHPEHSLLPGHSSMFCLGYKNNIVKQCQCHSQSWIAESMTFRLRDQHDMTRADAESEGAEGLRTYELCADDGCNCPFVAKLIRAMSSF